MPLNINIYLLMGTLIFLKMIFCLWTVMSTSRNYWQLVFQSCWRKIWNSYLAKSSDTNDKMWLLHIFLHANYSPLLSQYLKQTIYLLATKQVMIFCPTLYNNTCKLLIIFIILCDPDCACVTSSSGQNVIWKHEG